MAKTTMIKLKGKNTFQVKSRSGKTAKNAVKRRVGKCVVIKKVNKSNSWAGDDTNRNMYWVDFKKKC